MNREEIIEFMSKSKDVREWNSRRGTLMNEAVTKEDSKLISTIVDGSGLINRIGLKKEIVNP